MHCTTAGAPDLRKHDQGSNDDHASAEKSRIRKYDQGNFMLANIALNSRVKMILDRINDQEIHCTGSM